MKKASPITRWRECRRQIRRAITEPDARMIELRRQLSEIEASMTPKQLAEVREEYDHV